MINITVRSKRYNCTIELKQKVTIIRGHSGVGKTTFYKALDSSSGVYKILVSDDRYELLPLHHKGWEVLIEAGIDKSSKYIYVIDDDDLIITKEFARFLSEDKTSYFLIINRFERFSPEAMNGVPFSVNEVYKLVSNGKEHITVPYYTYGEVNLEKIKINRCIVEDSKSGFEFFKKLYSQMDVSSVYSKDKIVLYIKNNIQSLRDKKILMIVDVAALGSKFDLIQEFVSINELNVVIFRNYNCFEYLLLRSNMFKFDFSLLTNEEIASEMSLERLSEVILERETKNKFYYYNKGNLNRCYTDECCYRNQNQSGSVYEHCDKGMYGNKIEALLKDTEFEKLLLIGK